MNNVACLIPVVIAIAIMIRLFAGSMDRERIRNHVSALGGRILECTWSPLGPGWFGDKDNRIYQVRYVDRDGDTHMAYCKTSFWGGVYFTRDKVVSAGKSETQNPKSGKPEVSHERLEQENQRLREELDRIKRNQG